MPGIGVLYMQIVNSYRDDNKLRASFNELSSKVFGLDFEGWYQNGFWKDNYNPYSVIIDGKVVSNISVNRCNMIYKGKEVKLIQLGTVMTDPDYRGKGYAKALMDKILNDFSGKVDGIYLFANDSVLDFYPKFGFKTQKEYCYVKDVSFEEDESVVTIPMKDKKDYEKMTEILKSNPQNSAFYMTANPGLYMFYLSQFMTENTFYIPKLNSYVIAEEEEGELILHAILGDAAPDRVAAAFGKDIRRIRLSFTPKDASGYLREEVNEEDTTLFVIGSFFEETKDDIYMFQALTHA